MGYNQLTVKEQLGIILKHNRKVEKISQQLLAERLNYTQSIISRIEKGYDEIHLDLYIKALNLLRLKYEEDKAVSERVSAIEEELYQRFLVKDYSFIQSYELKIDALVHYEKNIITVYRILLLELVLHYANKDFSECRVLADEIDGVYKIFDKKLQSLFIYIKNGLFVYNTSRCEIRGRLDSLLFTEHTSDGLTHYANGYYYYKTYHDSNAIEYLHTALTYFREQKNIARLLKCHYLMNNILLKEHDYLTVKSNSLALIELVTEKDRHFAGCYYQLAYSLYYLEEYNASLKYFQLAQALYEPFEQQFVDYMVYKVANKLNDSQLALKVRHQEHYLFLLYDLMTTEKTEEYYLLIEKHINPQIEEDFYKREIQFYSLELLDYYWSQKSYKNYKKLSDRLHHVMHNF